MNTSPNFKVGPWLVVTQENKLVSLVDNASVKLEPKSMELLECLHHQRGKVMLKQDILDHVWPGVIVTDDALTRTVSRLRKALKDDAKPHQYIKTVPKRGYLLAANVSHQPVAALHKRRSTIAVALLLLLLMVLGLGVYRGTWMSQPESKASELLDRAGAFYAKLTEHDVDSAILLYEQVLHVAPANAEAHAGLANALVQKRLRWPTDVQTPPAPSIALALSSGWFETPQAKQELLRAQALAERGLRLAPNHAKTSKALALVYSAQGKLSQAKELYQQAIANDPYAWVAKINLGEIYLIENNKNQALTSFAEAYSTMQERYDVEPHLVGPLQPEVGLAIAYLYEHFRDYESARHWYQEILSKAPLHAKARAGLQALNKSAKAP